MDALLTSGLKHIDAMYSVATKLTEAKLAPHQIYMGTLGYGDNLTKICINQYGKVVTIYTSKESAEFDSIDYSAIVACCKKFGFTPGSVTEYDISKDRKAMETAWRDLCQSLSSLKTNFWYDRYAFLRANFKVDYERYLLLGRDLDDSTHIIVQIPTTRDVHRREPKEAASVLNFLFDIAFKEETGELLLSGLHHIDVVYFVAEKLVDAKLAPHNIGMGIFGYGEQGKHISIWKRGTYVMVCANDKDTNFDPLSIDKIVAHCVNLGFTPGSVTKTHLARHREALKAAWRGLCWSLSKLKGDFTYDSGSFLCVFIEGFGKNLNLCHAPNNEMCITAQIEGRRDMHYREPTDVASAVNILFGIPFKSEGEK